MGIDESIMSVRINQQWDRTGIGLWFMRTNRRGYTEVAKPLELNFEEHGPKDSAFMLPEPTLWLGYPASHSFFKSFGEEMIRNGFSTSNDKAAGRLEAQTKHLEDIQKLNERLMDFAFTPQTVINQLDPSATGVRFS